MAHGDEARRAVRAAYVFDQLGLEVAAQQAGVPLPTARRWLRDAKAGGDDWNRARAAQLIAGGGIEEIARQTMAAFAQQMQATLAALQGDESLPPAERAKLIASVGDAFTKLMAGHKRLMPETDKLAVAMDVLKRLLDFVRARAPQHAVALAEVLEPFADELAKAYG